MNYRIIAALLFVFYFVACKNQDKKNNEGTPAPATATEEQQKLTDPFFFKTLEGNIAGQRVIMHILKSRDRIDANYYYTSQGQTIFLIKNWEKESNDSIYLLEVTNPVNGESPTLALSVNADGITGTWNSADGKKSYPVELKESNTGTVFNFIALSAVDSSKYLKFKADTPMLKTSVTAIMATGQNDHANWLNNQFKTIIDNGNSRMTTLSLPQTVAAIVKEDVDGYKADADSSLVGIDVQGPHFFLNREYEKRSNIIYNQNGYVVMSFFNYAYTGGAHGNYGTSVYCFDTDHKKQLSLNDIVTIDSSQLQDLLENHYRKQYNVSAATPIEERLFVKRIAPNGNIYFSPGGLGFIYTPYEIASYADGEINIWIPFAELKPYLNPEFAKRMQL